MLCCWLPVKLLSSSRLLMLIFCSLLMCYLHATCKGSRQSLKVRGLSMLICSKLPGVQMPQQGKIVCAVHMQHGALAPTKPPKACSLAINYCFYAAEQAPLVIA